MEMVRLPEEKQTLSVATKRAGNVLQNIQRCDSLPPFIRHNVQHLRVQKHQTDVYKTAAMKAHCCIASAES